ncbi:MAG: AMP-dependent synthetase/ligase [Acidimicrobiales bacterium]
MAVDIKREVSASTALAEAKARGSIVDVFWVQVGRLGPKTALRWRSGTTWDEMSWAEYGASVRQLVAGLVHVGFEPGDRAAILSNNRREWHVADLAIMAAGGVSVPVYQTSSSSQVTYALAHAQARVCFVEDVDQLAKVLLRRHELPALEHLVAFDPPVGLDDDFVAPFEDVLDLGADRLEARPDLVRERAADIEPSALATLVYTSGTTGRPKATMLTHGNVMANIRHITAVIPIDERDRFLSFLPLSHIAERTVSNFAQVFSGGETWFAQSLASVPVDLRACRPTVFFAVPRVWEKFQEGVLMTVEHQPGVVRRVGERYLAAPAEDQGTDPPLVVFGKRLAGRAEHTFLDVVLGRRIRAQLGLDRARVFASAAAPISPDLLSWYARVGIPIIEAYGQTEGCGVTTLNPPDAIRIGTVGKAAPGVSVRTAPDHEVLVKGDNVCTGYYEDPAGTAQLIDADGWMHTGDLGAVDRDGYLTITGRKKDLIILSSGKNISPEEIETQLRNEPLLSQAVVFGEGRPYLTALLTLDDEAVATWAERKGRLPEAEALHEDPELIEEVTRSIERVNARNARIEGIKRWHVLPHDFTVADGELTPTLKVKRKVVLDRHAPLIEQLYAA